MAEETTQNLAEDGIDRRGFLECMAWAGSGVVFSMVGGVLKSTSLNDILGNANRATVEQSTFNFVQISDSHIGFSKEANKDVVGTLQLAINQINAAKVRPYLLLHTGDISHLSKDSEFDAVDQLLKGVHADQKFYVPGEHDVLNESGKNYRERYGKGTQGDGWMSFDHKGVHFIGLVNVMNLKAGGLGYLGEDQLSWLEKDLKGLSNSTPIVVFAHVPLWTVYPEWGWGTEDGARALAMLKRFGSVAVLNGHIHQVMQKVEGNITFHTARSTAFPQPAPGSAPSPGPMKVPADKLTSVLGITHVNLVHNHGPLAIVDSTLAVAAEGAPKSVTIGNFTFDPSPLVISKGTTVKWTNKDDMPHNVADDSGRFKSPALDTDETWSHVFTEPGRYDYFCSIHPKMTGRVIVN